jgi:hypothetical protein
MSPKNKEKREALVSNTALSVLSPRLDEFPQVERCHLKKGGRMAPKLTRRKTRSMGSKYCSS